MVQDTIPCLYTYFRSHMESLFREIQTFLLGSLLQGTTRLFPHVVLQVKHRECIESAH